MTGIAQVGISYKGKEIDLKGYKRFTFSAKNVKYISSDNLYTVYFSHNIPILLERNADSYFSVDSVDLYVNSVIKGRMSISSQKLSAYIGKLTIPGQLNFKKVENNI